MAQRTKKKDESDIGLGEEVEKTPGDVKAPEDAQAPEDAKVAQDAKTPQDDSTQPPSQPQATTEPSIKATKKDWKAMATMHAAQYLKFGDNPPTTESTQTHIAAAKRYEAICLSQIDK